MKKRGKTLVSLLIALSMLFLYVPFTMGAAEMEENEPAEIVEELTDEQDETKEADLGESEIEEVEEEKAAASSANGPVPMAVPEETPEDPSADNQAGTHQELRNAISGASEGDVIELADSFVMTSTITVNKDITISGKGNNLEVSGYFRHFIVSTGKTLTLHNITLDGKNVGGGVNSNKANIKVTYSTIQNCVGQSSQAGALQAHNNTSNMEIRNTKLLNNTATSNGGAVRLDCAGSFVMSDCTVSGNTTGDYWGYGGGGILLGYAVDATLTNVDITNNHSGRGGGLMLSGSNSTMTATNVNVKDNTATDLGAGVCLAGGVVNWNGGTISGNNNLGDGSNGGYGGGMAIWSYGNPNEYKSDVTINGTIISDNSAKVEGGGIWILSEEDRADEMAKVKILGAKVSGNNAKYGAGALLCRADVQMSDTAVKNNDGYDGGGIFANDVDLTISGGQFEENTAERDGGGLFLVDSDVSISGNTLLKKNSAKYGGGILSDESPLVIKNSRLEENIAEKNGGAIWTYDLNDISGENIVFERNVAEKGYVITDEADMAVHNSKFKNVTATGAFDYAYNNHDIFYTGGVEEAYFTVTFDGKGGSFIAPHTDVLYGKTIAAPADPIRAGYTFKEWRLGDENGSVWDFDVDKVTSDITLVAIWEEVPVTTYTVTFDSQGGSPVAPYTDVPENTTILQPASPTRNGYNFIEWRKDSVNGTKWNFNTDLVTDNTTLYAVWEEVVVPVTYYTVAFDSAGGSAVDPQTVKEGDLVNRPVNPTRNGYTFDNWYLNGSVYSFSAPVLSNMTLVARWTPNPVDPSYTYTVTFDGNGADTAIQPASMTVTYPATTVGSLPYAPGRTGFTFNGWYTSRTGGSEFTTNTRVTGNMTVYARWSIRYFQLSFDTNGASTPTPTEQSLAYGALASPVETPQKPGNTFVGWNTAADGSGTSWNFSRNTMPASNVTLYAQWQQGAFAFGNGQSIDSIGRAGSLPGIGGGNPASEGGGEAGTGTGSTDAPTMTIGDNEVPLYGFGGEFWAASNLLFLLVGIAGSVFTIGRVAMVKKPGTKQDGKRLTWSLISLGSAAVSVILYFATQRTGAQMVLFDGWTAPMVALLGLEITGWVMSLRAVKSPFKTDGQIN